MDHPAERVALIELLDRDGRVQRSIDVPSWPITLGRSLDNLVVLDDPHVAAEHARLERAEDGTVLLQLGDTRNGAQVGTRHLAAGEQAALDGQQDGFQLGTTRLRLRLPGQPLPAELPLPVEAGRRALTWWLVPVLALLVWWPMWLSLDPGGEWTVWLPLVLGTPAALALWTALWALASKLFQHRFDFWGHAAIVLRVLVPVQLLGLLLPPLSAALNLPSLWQAAQWLQPAALAVLAWRHGRRVLPGHVHAVAMGVAALLVLGVGTTVMMNHQRFERWQREPYMSSLPGPSWRWHSPVPVTRFLDDARALQPRLEARVKDAQADDTDDDDSP
jgi:hypothetical protein